MPTGINIYNEDGELILDNNRRILCAVSNPIQESFALTNINMIDHEAFYYDASTATAQTFSDGNAKTLDYVDGDEGAVWISCNDSSVNFVTYAANIVAFYPYRYNQAAKSVAYKRVVSKIPDKVTTDGAYIVVYSEDGSICWSAASLIRSVRIIGFITITDGMLFNKSVLYFDVPAAFPMSDIFVPMFTGIGEEGYGVSGLNYLKGVIFKYVGNRVYAKLFYNIQETSGVLGKDTTWTGGTRLIPIAYIPAV